MSVRGAGEWLSRAAPLLDALSVVIAGYGAWCARFQRGWPPDHYLLALLLGVLLVLVLLPAARSYRGRHWHRPLRGVVSALPGLVTVFVCLLLIATLTKTTADFSRLWMMGWAGLSLVVMAFWRRAFGAARGGAVPRVVLLGTGKLAVDAATRLRRLHGDDSVAGFVRLPEEDGDSGASPELGRLGQLDEILASVQPPATELWLASDSPPDSSNESLFRRLRMSSLPVRYVPDLRLLRLLGHRASEVAGMTVIELNATPLDGPDAFIKAAMDRAVALLLLIVLSPLLALIALAIRLDSPGPVLFSQSRHGGGGQVIEVLKFRSMTDHAPSEFRQAKRNDGRVTRVGTLLRRSSLDELPQLINVLRGDMSLVGPRPHPLELNQAFSERLAAFMQRHRVKPGITGLAQINGCRGETETLEKMQKRLDYDLHYIENWTLWLDIRILVKTALSGWFDRNAY